MRVLVSVASRHGATWELGECVAKVLSERGHAVEMAAPEEVTALDGIDAVVLGSAVYLAHWMPAARELAHRLGAELAGRPVWLFSSGLATQPASGANSPNEIQELRERLGALGHRAFRGRLDRSLLSFTERAAIAGARAREGDHRDFAAVERWAGTIADALDAAVPHGVVARPEPAQA